MAVDVVNIKVCSPLKLRSGSTGKQPAIGNCIYLRNVTCNPKRTTVQTLSNMTIAIIFRQDEQQNF